MSHPGDGPHAPGGFWTNLARIGWGVIFVLLLCVPVGVLASMDRGQIIAGCVGMSVVVVALLAGVR